MLTSDKAGVNAEWGVRAPAAEGNGSGVGLDGASVQLRRQGARAVAAPAELGFTLMEIMAAVFMLGVLLLPLLTIKERATSRVERAHARLVALGHAENMLSLARRDPKEHLEEEGRVDGDERYRYEFTLENWDTSTSFADTDDDDEDGRLFTEDAPLDAGIPPAEAEEETDPHKVRRFQIEIFWPDFERPDQEDSIRLDGFLPRVPEERSAVFNR